MIPWEDIEILPEYINLPDWEKSRKKQAYWQRFIEPSEAFQGLTPDDRRSKRDNFLGDLPAQPQISTDTTPEPSGLGRLIGGNGGLSPADKAQAVVQLIPESPPSVRMRIGGAIEAGQNVAKQGFFSGVGEEIGKAAMGFPARTAETVGAALQYVGSRMEKGYLEKKIPLAPGYSMADLGADWARMGKEASDYWKEKQEPYQQAKELQGKNIWDNPEMLKNPKWWAYNVTQMGLDLGISIVPALGAAKIINQAGQVAKMAPHIVRNLSQIGAQLTGGVAGSTLEATQTYRDVLEQTGDENEAARAAEGMFASVVALQTFSTGKILDVAGKKFMSKLSKIGKASWAESWTEGAEEPAEVASKIFAKLIQGKEPPEDIGQMFIDSLKEGLTVMPIAAVTGGGMAAGIGGGVSEKRPKPVKEDPRMAALREVLNRKDISRQALEALRKDMPADSEAAQEIDKILAQLPEKEKKAKKIEVEEPIELKKVVKPKKEKPDALQRKVEKLPEKAAEEKAKAKEEIAVKPPRIAKEKKVAPTMPEPEKVAPDVKPVAVEAKEEVKKAKVAKEPWEMGKEEFAKSVKTTENLRPSERVKVLYAEDIELKPEAAKIIDNVANMDAVTGEIYAYKMGEDGIYNHADIFAKHKMKDATTITGFIDKDGDFVYQYPEEAHKLLTQQAIKEGKPVPESVLADYPDLKPDVVKPLPELKSTQEALEFGKIATPEQQALLKERRESFLDRSKKAREAGDYDAAMVEATKAQFDREALEAEKVEVEKEQPPAKEGEKVEPDLTKRHDAMNAKYAPLIGTKIISGGQEWSYQATNDLGVPYFSKVVRGKTQKKQFTVAMYGKEWLDEQLVKKEKVEPTPPKPTEAAKGELILSGRDIKKVKTKGDDFTINVKLTDIDVRWQRADKGEAFDTHEKELTLGVDEFKEFKFLYAIANRMDLTETGRKKLTKWWNDQKAKPTEEEPRSAIDLLKDEKGFLSLDALQKSPAYDGVLTKAKGVLNQGHTTYTRFYAEMKKAFKEVWGKIKAVMKDLYRTAKKILVDEQGMLAGREAVTAPVGQIDKAQSMLDQGKTEQEVWDATGWTKDPSGKWMFRIDDSGAKLMPQFKDDLYSSIKGYIKKNGRAPKLSEVIDHSKVFEAYPRELENVTVGTQPDTGGRYAPGAIFVGAGSNMETLLHEISHAVQEIEGFARGGMPSDINQDVVNLLKEANKRGKYPEWDNLSTAKKVEMAQALGYQRLAGEILAREAGAKYTGVPGTMEGIPRDQWIVKDGDGTSFSVEAPVTAKTPEQIIDEFIEKYSEKQPKAVHEKKRKTANNLFKQGKKALNTRFGKQYINRDMKWYSKAFLPYWIGKKYRSIGKAVDVEIEAAEERSTMVWNDYQGALGDIQDEMRKDKTALKDLEDLIWKWDRKRFSKKHVPADWAKDLEADELEVNPDHYRQIKKYLAKQGVSKKAIKAFIVLRWTYDKKWIDIDKTLRVEKLDPELIETFRSEIGKIHNYFPHRRTGDAYVQIIKKAVKGKDSDVVYREHYWTFKDRALGVKGVQYRAGGRVKQWLADQIATGELAGSPSDYKITQGKITVLPDEVFFQVPLESMQQIAREAGQKLEEYRAEYEADRLYNKEGLLPEEALVKAKKRLHADMESAISKAFAEVFKARGFGRHAILSKGIPGHETNDIFGITFDYLSGYAGFKTKIKRSRKHHDIMIGLSAKQKPEEYLYLSNYVKDMLANQDKVDRAVDTLRGLFFAKYLGGVIKSGLVNLTQNLVLAAPTLSIYTKGATFKLGKAMSDVSKSLIGKAAWTGKEVKYERLSKDEQQVLHDLIEAGTTQDLYLRELMGTMPGIGLAKYYKKGISYAGLFMRIAEKFNRASTGLAAYRVGVKEKGMSYEDALKFAKDIVYDTHFLYGKPNLPSAMRGGTPQKLMRSAYTFRSFTFNYLSAIGSMYANQHYAAIARSLRNVILVGGLTSFPFFKLLSSLLFWALGREDEDPMTKIREAMPNEWVKDFVTYGLPGLVGADFSGSISIEAPRNWADIIGVPYSIGDDTANTIKALRSGSTYRAMSGSPITPIVVRNAMRGAELYFEGQRTRSGRDINYPGEPGPKKITAKEAIQKGVIGLQPTSISKGYASYQAISKMKEAIQKKKTAWADQFVNALRRGDKAEMKDIIKKQNNWNLKAGKDKKEWRGIDITPSVNRRLETGGLVGLPRLMRRRALEIAKQWKGTPKKTAVNE